MTLAKVSGWNYFRANQNYSYSFRYLYPSQFESFWTNPKNILYIVWWKTVKNQSDLIRFIPRNQCEWIRTIQNQVFNQNLSESFRHWIHSDWFWLKIRVGSIRDGLIRINLDWKLGFGLVRIHSDWCLGINRINSVWFLNIFHQTRYNMFFGLVRNDSNWLGYRYRKESK